MGSHRNCEAQRIASVGVKQARVSACIKQKFTNAGRVPLCREHEWRFAPAVTGIKVIASLNVISD